MTAYRVAVATSGGLDSTALLHCSARLAAQLGGEVIALHVHHGLQAHADDWLKQVAAQCKRWRARGLPLQFFSQRINSRPAPGDSIESWARIERYRALAEMAHAAGCGLVLLAHHRRDQAETVLLQALRGAGPAGLAAMPRLVERKGITWARPWLDRPREAIEAYARRWRLAHVEDPSNADARYARSRLRQHVWPSFAQAFSDSEVALCAVARHAQEARALADEVAQIDLSVVADASGLHVAAWSELSLARRANALRHWLARDVFGAVPDSLVQRMLLELPACRVGRWPAGPWPDALRLHAGVLRFVAPPGDSSTRMAGATAAVDLDLSQPGSYALTPWPGRVHVRAVAQGGLAAALLTHAQLRPRVGGERFQARANGVARSLKKQFQAQAVPAWLRDGPVVFAAGDLVCVPALGLDARAVAKPGTPRVSLRFSR